MADGTRESHIEIRRPLPLTFPKRCTDCGKATRHRVKIPVDMADRIKLGLTHLAVAFIPVLGLLAMASRPSGEQAFIPVCWRCRRPVIALRVLSTAAFCVAMVCFGFMPDEPPTDLIVGIIGILLLCTASALSFGAAFARLPVAVARDSGDYVYRFRTGAYRDWMDAIQKEPQPAAGE